MKYSSKKKTLIKKGYTVKWKQVGLFLLHAELSVFQVFSFIHSCSEFYFQRNYNQRASSVMIVKKNKTLCMAKTAL